MCENCLPFPCPSTLHRTPTPENPIEHHTPIQYLRETEAHEGAWKGRSHSIAVNNSCQDIYNAEIIYQHNILEEKSRNQEVIKRDLNIASISCTQE